MSTPDLGVWIFDGFIWMVYRTSALALVDLLFPLSSITGFFSTVLLSEGGQACGHTGGVRWGGKDGCAYGVAYEGSDNAKRPGQGGREREGGGGGASARRRHWEEEGHVRPCRHHEVGQNEGGERGRASLSSLG